MLLNCFGRPLNICFFLETVLLEPSSGSLAAATLGIVLSKLYSYKHYLFCNRIWIIQLNYYLKSYMEELFEIRRPSVLWFEFELMKNKIPYQYHTIITALQIMQYGHGPTAYQHYQLRLKKSRVFSQYCCGHCKNAWILSSFCLQEISKLRFTFS